MKAHLATFKDYETFARAACDGSIHGPFAHFVTDASHVTCPACRHRIAKMNKKGCSEENIYATFKQWDRERAEGVREEIAHPFVVCKDLEEVHTCDRCGGKGTVRRLPALASIDTTHFQAQSLVECQAFVDVVTKGAAINTQRFALFVAYGTSTLVDACREAILYAKRDDVACVFRWADVPVVVTSEDEDAAVVARKWWRAAHPYEPYEP